MAVTIRDIANQLTISHSTVSRALRDDPRISPETRLVVKRAAREMGYRVNVAARALASRRMQSVALIIPDVVDPFYASIIEGVDEETHRHHYNLVLYITHSEVEREESAVGQAAEGRYDGAIFFRRHLASKQLKRVVRSGTPLVLMTHQEPGLPIDSVRVDDVDGGYKATAYLIGLGHRRIGFVGGPPDGRETRDRRAGYHLALGDHGLCPDPELEWQGSFTEKGGRAAGAALAAIPPERRPSAVFAANDRMAIGMLQACQERGIPVPDALSIVGYDDISACAYVHPRLTTVRQPTVEMGALATRLLIERLQGTAASAREVLLKTDLVVRESCSPPQPTSETAENRARPASEPGAPQREISTGTAR